MKMEGIKIKRAIIVGATSGIGKELAIILANDGYQLGITGRRTELLQTLQNELPTKVITKYMDIDDVDNSRKIMQHLMDEMEDVNLVILCSGIGYINKALKWEIEEDTINTNIMGISAILTLAYSYFEQKKRGHLCAVSSIAAIKGDGYAPAYNASKAFLSNYLEGLYYKASKISKDIKITDIRPGLVDTAMAKGDGLFWVMPVNKAAKQIYDGIKRKKRIIYVTRRWKLIAVILRLIPTGIYKNI